MAAVRDYRYYRKADIDNKLADAHFRPLDIMVAGVTGAGKSTTLNSFFSKTVASVGDGTDPETMEIGDYRLNDVFRIWDTPGLGDSPSADRLHIQEITKLLDMRWSSGGKEYGFIDLALVILEGGSRDMHTTERLLNQVIIPHIQYDRILVAINQADFAMKGHHWNRITNEPDADLLSFLQEKANSVQRRVCEDTGVIIPHPIFYSAKYGYNVDKLFDLIIDHIPKTRRNV